MKFKQLLIDLLCVLLLVGCTQPAQQNVATPHSGFGGGSGSGGTVTVLNNDLNANGHAITNLNGFATPNHSPPYVLGEAGALIPSPTFANSNYILPGNIGQTGNGGDPNVNAVERYFLPAGEVPGTTGVSGVRIPQIVALTNSQFMLAWADLDNSGSNSDNTGKYIVGQRWNLNSDGTVYPAGAPIKIATESDWGSGHHAFNEFAIVPDQSGTIYGVITRVLYGTAAISAASTTPMSLQMVKSLDNGNSFSATTDITAKVQGKLVGYIANGVTSINLANISALATNGDSITHSDGTGASYKLTVSYPNSGSIATNYYVQLSGITGTNAALLNYSQNGSKAFQVTNIDATHIALTDAASPQFNAGTTLASATATPQAGSFQVGGRMTVSSDGAIWVGGYYRYNPNFSGTPYPFLFKTTDGFNTVTVYLVADETNSVLTTNGFIEPDVIETTPGNMTMFCRSVTTNGRGSIQLTSGASTLTSPILTTLNEANATMSGVAKLGDGRLIILHPNNTYNARRRATLRLVSANGVSYAKRTLAFGISWYNSICVMPDGETIIVLNEGGPSSQEGVAYEPNHLAIIRTTATALLNTANTLDEFRYEWNDGMTTGQPALTISGNEGATMRDSGPFRQHGTLFGSPTYIVDTNGQGMTFHTATSDYSQLAKTNNPAFECDVLSDDTNAITLEFTIKETASNICSFFSTTTAKGNSGLWFGQTAAGLPQFTAGTLEIDGTTAINDGKVHKIIVGAGRTGTAGTMSMKIDGVAVSPVAGSLGGSTFSSGLGAVLNGNSSHAQQPNADVTYYAPLRIVRGTPASNYSIPYTPTTQKYNSPPTPRTNDARSLFTSSQILLHLFDPLGGWGLRSDRMEYAAPVPPYAGWPLNSQVSHDANHYFGRGNAGNSAGMFTYVIDPFIGGCWRSNYAGGTIPFTLILDSRTTGPFDLLQNTSTNGWTILFKWVPYSHPGGLAIIFSSMGSLGSGHNGLQLIYDEGVRKIGLRVTSGGNSLTDDVFPNGNGGQPSMTEGQPYEIVVSGTGTTGAITLYQIPLNTFRATAPTISTLKYTSASYTPLTNASTDVLQFGNNIDGALSDFTILNVKEASVQTQIANFAISP